MVQGWRPQERRRHGKERNRAPRTGTISDERCYALFANVIIDTNAGAERLQKEHGLIAKDASMRISKVHTGDAQKHTRVTFIEYKVMEGDMHDG